MRTSKQKVHLINALTFVVEVESLDGRHCLKCHHFGEFGEYAESCRKHPEIGQTWDGISESKDVSSDLRHPNTGEWYWCIKECPDFAKKEE